MLKKIFGSGSDTNFYDVTKRQLVIGWLVCISFFVLTSHQVLEPILEQIFGNQNSDLIQIIRFLSRECFLFVILSILFFAFLKKSILDTVKSKKLMTCAWTVAGYLLVRVANTVTYCLIFGVARVLTGSFKLGQSVNQMEVQAFYSAHPVLFWVVAIALAPFVEEMIFRGIIFHTFRNMSKWLAVLGSSLLFGAVHVIPELTSGNWLEAIKILPYFATGLILGLVYEHQKNIMPCIGIHMLTEVIATIKLN